MTYANFTMYGDLLTEIITKLMVLPSEKFTIRVNDGKLIKYDVDLNDFKITLERERRVENKVKFKASHTLIIAKHGDPITFYDGGIDTNEPSVKSLRKFFYEIESRLSKKTVDKNRTLLEELLEKLGGK